MWHRILLLVGICAVPLTAATTVPQLHQFCQGLEVRLELLRTRGMDALKIVDDPSFQPGGNSPHIHTWHNTKAQFGAPVPAAVRELQIRLLELYSDADDGGGLSGAAARDDLKNRMGYAEVASKYAPGGNALFLVLVKNAVDPSSRPELHEAILVARFGNYGLFAPPGIATEVINPVKQLIAQAASPKLTERLDVPGLDWQATGTELLAANAGKGAAPVPVQAAPESTIGPQLKGYDPKEANRPPPSREPPPPQIVGYIPKKGFATSGESELRERERRAREERAKQAARPRLTMADYAKQAERERAAQKARRAKWEADNTKLFQWMVDGRKAREAQIRDAWQKRREHVDSQAGRTDAVMRGKIFDDGNWFKIPLRNLTDVSLWVTIDYTVMDKSGQQQHPPPIITTLFGLDSKDVIIIASEPGSKITDSWVSWKAVSGEYQNKVPVAY